MVRIFLIIAALFAIGPIAEVQAGTYVILVAPRDTPALTNAEAKQNEQTVFAERKLYKALTKAAEFLNQPGAHEVRIMIAAGEYTGQMAQGQWTIPAINNPEGSLAIIGGWNATWDGRQPFKHLVKLKTVEGRPGPMIMFTKNSVLKRTAVSGLLFDAAPSNKYDARSNSLLIATSRTYTLLAFRLLKTDRLVVADNIFLNGAQGTVEPEIYPMSNETTVTIRNNFFINNRFPTSTRGRVYKGAQVKTLNFINNSFILNWPYNPDPTSGNVGVINLYTKDCCTLLNIEGNLFAFNPGGAMQQDWVWDRMPKTRIHNNLFFSNAMLFGNDKKDAGVIVGKFGLNPKYLIADLYMLEDEFDYDVSGNVSFDPKVPLTFPALLAANSADVKRENTGMNDIRRLFGMNQSGGNVAIANYAPLVKWRLALPQEEKAKAYGVQPGKLWSVKGW
jgi:hypothetical protein